jgi:hypothetical protein
VIEKEATPRLLRRHVRTDLSIQAVNLAADALERVRVVRLDCRVALLLEVSARRLRSLQKPKGPT